MPLSLFRTLPIPNLHLPAPLAPLADLACNLWWSWNPWARKVFKAVDPARWERERNPLDLLFNLDPRRAEALAKDVHFIAQMSEVLEAFNAYLHPSTPTWFERGVGARKLPRGIDWSHPVAYFCSEYGLHESLPFYSGGLGVLAGDHLKAASDLGIPFIGVGLLYRHGYFVQALDADGSQQHFPMQLEFDRMPTRRVRGPDGGALMVTVDFPGRDVHAAVRVVDVGRVPLLLLDTDIEENLPEDRLISSHLYIRGREMRLCQEWLLGVGAIRVLEALGLEPCSYHINEGHSVFVNFERVRVHVREGNMTVEEALADVRKHTVFTTHTPVPAGNEVFDVNMVRRYLERLAADLGVEVSRLIDLATLPEKRESFNLTVLALRTSSRANGVSLLHSKVSNNMWSKVCAEEQTAVQRIEHVTNGVHTLTWLGPDLQDLLYAKADLAVFEENYVGGHAFDFWREVPDDAIWQAHMTQKLRLLTVVGDRLRRMLARHGASPDEVAAVAGSLDLDTLTIGFARRFATYKRAGLIFRDPGRLEYILKNPKRPVRLIFAGKAHPADRPGQDLAKLVWQMSRDPRYVGHIFFVEDYDMRLGRMLTQGCDVWLNVPRRPMEACGTSGQKASTNGLLNFSVPDGWWDEVVGDEEAALTGWGIGEATGVEDHMPEDERDDLDAERMYTLLEREIAPTYYDHRRPNGSGNAAPHAWIEHFKAAMSVLGPRFSAGRMVSEYMERFYGPLSRG